MAQRGGRLSERQLDRAQVNPRSGAVRDVLAAERLEPRRQELDVLLDLASRRVLGFALGEHHDAQLAYGALAMAVAARGGQVPGVIMHTDRGSEYTAALVQQACQRLSIRQSMGRPGSALDNAVIESWHSTLEFELRSVEHFDTRAQARARVSTWIQEYNRDRRHSALGMMSPVSYEQALQDTKAP